MHTELCVVFNEMSQTKSGNIAVETSSKSCTFMCKCIVFSDVNSLCDFIHGKTNPLRLVTAVVSAYPLSYS